MADLASFETYGYLSGVSPLRWRSGIKHDCSRVIELRPREESEGFENGLGEVVHLESNYLYPMLKSSDLNKPRPLPSRYMLVTQRSVGEDTSRIKSEAPRTWNYLLSHSDRLDRRASSIYRNRPAFLNVRGGAVQFRSLESRYIGALQTPRISMHIGPIEDKPVVLDDTCYFLPCQTQSDAELLTKILNSKSANGFFRSLVFWDTKQTYNGPNTQKTPT